MADSTFEFSHGEVGLTRFPPNVEQITVERESTRTWLVVRRNDTVIRLPLTDADSRHLASLLMPAGYACVPREPTQDMLDAAYWSAHEENAAGVWEEMIAASTQVLEIRSK